MNSELAQPWYFDNPLRRWLLRLTGGSALIGGLLIVGMAFLTVISILGRWLAGIPWVAEAVPGLSSIVGDYELIEMGTAIAIFAFLPYTQMRYGHVSVDILVDHLPARGKAMLTALANSMFTLMAGVLTWRAWHGLGDKLNYQETTMILGVPVWYGYAPAVLFLGLLTLACAYTAVEAVLDSISPNPAATRAVRGDDAPGGE